MFEGSGTAAPRWTPGDGALWRPRRKTANGSEYAMASQISIETLIHRRRQANWYEAVFQRCANRNPSAAKLFPKLPPIKIDASGKKL